MTSRRADCTLAGAPVDLVGEDEVGEHGAELDPERLARRPVDAGADEVRGDEVGRELDAGERAADGGRHRLDGEGLGQAGDALDEAVATCQQAHEHPLEQPVLAHDDLLGLEEDALEEGGLLRAGRRGGAGTGEEVGRRRDRVGLGGRERCRVGGGQAGRRLAHRPTLPVAPEADPATSGRAGSVRCGSTDQGARMAVSAYILIQTEVGKAAAVAEEVGGIDGVVSSEDVTGPYDVIVRAESGDLDELGKMVVSRVQMIDGITRTLTCTVVHL
jgi:DNA-binding Lrp family transcriptional regulator